MCSQVIQVRAEQQVNEELQQQPHVLEVACSGSLVLPAYTTEPPPLGRSPLAAAIHVLIQHIATLGQEPSDLSADTNVHGENSNITIKPSCTYRHKAKLEPLKTELHVSCRELGKVELLLCGEPWVFKMHHHCVVSCVVSWSTTVQHLQGEMM